MTNITRVGNIALYNSTMKDVSDVQRRLAELQEQISSGIKAKDFAGLNGQVEQFTLLEAKMRSSEKFISSNQLNLSRMNTADQAMEQAIDIADSMENLIVQSRSDVLGSTVDMPQVMRGYLNQLSSALNINFEGRYLFGGTRTSEPPVADIQSPSAVLGFPDDSYYAGSKDDITYKSDERNEYSFPVRADDPAFQKIIAAAHQAMAAFRNGSTAELGQALDLMQAGQVDLNTARARVGNTILSVESTNESLKSLSLYWKGVTEEVSKTDLVAASTEVSNHEAILQAAFAVFARLSQLRLTDYL